MEISGVYCIEDIVSKKVYIGSSVDIYNRWSGHRQALKKNRHHSFLLQRAYNKHGKDSFVYRIVEEVPNKMAILEREQYWMDFYKSYLPKNGYNRSNLAFGTGVPCSETHKKHLSKVNSGNSYHLGYKGNKESKKLMSDRAVDRCLRKQALWKTKCDTGYRSPQFGSKFNHWTIIDPYTPDKLTKSSTLYLLCRCDCGLESPRFVRTLVNGRSKECHTCSNKSNNLYQNFYK